MVNEHEIERSLRETKLTTSSALDDRVLTAASVRLATNQSTAKPSQRILRRLIPSIVVAAVAVAVGMWWFSRPDNNTWAQVVKAVNEKPWIHLSGKTPQGRQEAWLSMKGAITAYSNETRVSWHNFDTGVSETYLKKGEPADSVGKIVRSANSTERDGYDFFVSLFKALFRGDEEINIKEFVAANPDIEDIEQSRRKIKDDEGHWYEYVLAMRVAGDFGIHKMIFRVDLKTMLPRTMKVVDEGEEETTTVMSFDIDFPDVGPTDIYALGVPKDAEIIEPKSIELAGTPKDIVDSIRKAAEGFEDYRAILVITKPESPWHVTSPMRIWKKGGRWRLEVGIIDPDHPPKIEVTTPDIDRRKWWKQWCEQLWFYPRSLSEGTNAFQNTFIPTEKLHSQFLERMSLPPNEWNKADWDRIRGYRNDWPAKTTPIIFSYPENLVESLTNPTHKAELTTNTEDGAVQTVIVTVRSKSGEKVTPEWTSEVIYHLDPSRDYIVIRNSHLSYREENGERVILGESTSRYDDFEKSPRGYWYPTTIRDKSVYQEGNKMKTTESLARLYLDFNIDIPDSLFQPEE